MIMIPTKEQYYEIMLNRWISQFKGEAHKVFERTDDMYGRKFSPICIVPYSFAP